MKGQYQQGDVYIEKVELIPAGAKQIKAVNGRYVIAHGETTGHAHVVEEIEGMEVYEKDGVYYIKSPGPYSLQHEEHGAIAIMAEEKDIMEFGQIYEFDPFEQEIRKIRD